MKSQVFFQNTSPGNVMVDYQKLLGHFPKPKNTPTIVKLNLSWTKFFPAVSTPPWHFQAILQWLTDAGVSPKNIIPVENRTVVTKVEVGARNHAWTKVAKKFGVKIHYLTKEKYFNYRPRAKMLVLDKIFPEGIYLPQVLVDTPLVSLCTLKAHVFTTMTGAIKNYFGMLTTKRHYCHRYIHQAIIDLLQIQKELHPQIYAVMDGSVVGFGSGPRAMQWKEANLLFGSSDEVALDATAARIMGFKPREIEFLKLGQKLNLGYLDQKSIQIIGTKKLPNLNVGIKRDTFASRGQKFIYGCLPEWVEKLLLHTFIAPWSYAASNLYHDVYWYNFVGKARLFRYLRSGWGKLFRSYFKSTISPIKKATARLG